MNDLSCEVIKDLLPLYVDDICSDDSKQMVKNHLDNCEDCKREFHQISRQIHVEQKNNDQSTISGISKKWKKDKKRAFVYGILFLFVIVAAVVDFIMYSNFTISIKEDDIRVSNVSELVNGKIFFTLEVANQLYAKDYDWQVKDHAVYITINSTRYNIFHKMNEKYDFAKNTNAKNNWLFNVNNTGIEKIYYCSGHKPEEEKNAILIWSKDLEVNKADDAVKTYVQTYACYGNSEPGLLAEQLFAAKNPYVGDMSANGQLASILNIQNSLGSYKNQLQTSEEPYGWRLEFQDAIDETEEEKFNQTMTDYAYVLLALTNNLGEVTWTYDNGVEVKEIIVTADEASRNIGENIKNFSEESINIQELLLKIGIE